MPDRFVILHHRQEAGEHWDLMLERGEVLWTWRLARDPLDPKNYPIPAERIGDHRKAYLTFEGAISGGRGTVRRVEEGASAGESNGSDDLCFRLTGTSLSGRFRVAVLGDGSTVFASVPVSST